MNSPIQIQIKELLDEAKHSSSTNPDKAWKLSKEAYDLAKENHFRREEGDALLGISFACRAKSEIDQMLQCSYDALEIYDELQVQEGQTRALNLIGIAYFYDSEYEQALQYLIRAQYILELNPDPYMLSCVYNNIGEVYRETLKYEKALEFYNLGLLQNGEINSDMNKASLLGNIGEIYYLRDMTEEALLYFTQGYQLLLQEEDAILLAETENKLGKVYISRNDYTLAKEYLNSALSRLEGISNKYYAIEVLLNIAQLEIKTEQRHPIYYFELAIRYAVDTNAKKKLCTVYRQMAEFYEKVDDYRSALDCFKLYHNLEKEISVSRMGNKFKAMKIELEYLYEDTETANTQIINTRLEMEIARQKQELEEIHRINEILEKKAYEDELTEIPNRRYINQELTRIWNDPAYHDQAIALYIIDIDNFKKFNDCWGHCAGDQCLQKVANCLKWIQYPRKDIFGRYGGEEFIYIALNISFYEALELGELFRTQVETMTINLSKEEYKNSLTISVGGIWGKRSDFSDTSEVVHQADRQLYKAKAMGRNKTIVTKNIG